MKVKIFYFADISMIDKMVIQSIYHDNKYVSFNEMIYPERIVRNYKVDKLVLSIMLKKNAYEKIKETIDTVSSPKIMIAKLGETLFEKDEDTRYTILYKNQKTKTYHVDNIITKEVLFFFKKL